MEKYYVLCNIYVTKKILYQKIHEIVLAYIIFKKKIKSGK